MEGGKRSVFASILADQKIASSWGLIFFLGGGGGGHPIA